MNLRSLLVTVIVAASLSAVWAATTKVVPGSQRRYALGDIIIHYRLLRDHGVHDMHLLAPPTDVSLCVGNTVLSLKILCGGKHQAPFVYAGNFVDCLH
ncbi:hypothetical protein PF005_g29077 [Phytophthora fragariae]|uniref:Uncharacterized protein n=1 Tax=Phytophthora fragariae TaxID=53985 RepID=A0A6A3QAF4_9STRA|nr:hypothetical protein PF003_g12807 [Phytophthora fragariae]KAE8920169.1 hypothetical protein PF009_g29535 [Phytophthora fragariae]KAE8965868.1 hypothetical protein PF011_g28134 [Phytophthora fragariae]KAE9064255.1 hypothetical protein PF010_g28677 [Phytophthora fragariae]KAE9071565.1 hypothetical protein PF007_g26506 [Phytophthora fragariae]